VLHKPIKKIPVNQEKKSRRKEGAHSKGGPGWFANVGIGGGGEWKKRDQGWGKQ